MRGAGGGVRASTCCFFGGSGGHSSTQSEHPGSFVSPQVSAWPTPSPPAGLCLNAILSMPPSVMAPSMAPVCPTPPHPLPIPFQLLFPLPECTLTHYIIYLLIMPIVNCPCQSHCSPQLWDVTHWYIPCPNTVPDT